MRTIVLTGASDGIGAAAARQLVAKGERVVLVGRSREKTSAVAEPLGMPFHLADFADLAQVRALADELRETYPRIDVLANNAGGIFGPRTLTADGFEQSFQVNHLAGFLLTNLLIDTLASSGAAVIQTSSVAARRFARFDIDDLQAERSYSSESAYGNAKLANILFTRELHLRFHERGISTAAFHPGVVATRFAADAGGFLHFVYHNPLTRRLLTTTDEGGARLTWLAAGESGTDWVSGGYYERNHLAKTNALAHDPVVARELWERSAELVGLA